MWVFLKFRQYIGIFVYIIRNISFFGVPFTQIASKYNIDFHRKYNMKLAY